MMPKEESGVSEPTAHPSLNQQKPGPWSALLRVITEPAATFQALAERPAILPAYLLAMAIGLVAAVISLPLTKAGVAEQMAKSPTAPGTAAQFAEIVAISIAFFVALAGPWLAGLIVALIANFAAQFQGGSAGFRTYFSMVGYARVPLAVGGLLQAALMSRAATFQQAQSMSLSLAALAPEGTNSILKTFLSTINPIGLFYYALLAIGFAVVQRMKPSRGAIFAGTVYVLGLLVMLAGAAFSQSSGM